MGGLIVLVLLTGGCATRERQVSYQSDVRPVLEANCIECHIPPDGKGYRKSGLSMVTYQDLMKGTIYGPVIVPGDSMHSIVNMLVEGRASPSMRMPHGREQLVTQEIETLRLWVEQGAQNN